ncbi:MAG: type II toxin-antitoxin system RatA family toxin [Azospirillaceae bacterium]
MGVHAEQRVLPHSRDKIFDMVADVGRYPEFLPWCLAARIREKTDDHLVADLVIGFKMVRERFTSRVHLRRPEEIHVEYVEGPLRYLNNRWIFTDHPDGTLVDFSVDYEFRSRVLQNLIGGLFHQAYKKIVSAFEKRADALYTVESRAVELSVRSGSD